MATPWVKIVLGAVVALPIVYVAACMVPILSERRARTEVIYDQVSRVRAKLCPDPYEDPLFHPRPITAASDVEEEVRNVGIRKKVITAHELCLADFDARFPWHGRTELLEAELTRVRDSLCPPPNTDHPLSSGPGEVTDEEALRQMFTAEKKAAEHISCVHERWVGPWPLELRGR
jgi:hypothetical protein